MQPVKFQDVRYLGIAMSKPVTKYDYELIDTNGDIWTFGVYEGGDLVAFERVPRMYNEFLGKKQWMPFFREVEKAAKKAIEGWKIKKDLSSQTAKTFEDIIDEL